MINLLLVSGVLIGSAIAAPIYQVEPVNDPDHSNLSSWFGGGIFATTFATTSTIATASTITTTSWSNTFPLVIIIHVMYQDVAFVP